jgi:hypothetical protein
MSTSTTPLNGFGIAHLLVGREEDSIAPGKPESSIALCKPESPGRGDSPTGSSQNVCAASESLSPRAASRPEVGSFVYGDVHSPKVHIPLSRP